MKLSYPRSHAHALLLVACAFGLAFPSLAGEKINRPAPKSAPKSAKPGAAATNAVPVSPELPKSVFIIPATPEEGKDPFFPHSTRLFNTVVIPVTHTNRSTPIPVDLHLRGISGTPDHRLAIINTSTFEAGEERDMRTNAGQVRVRCVEINPDSVVVQTAGERRVLKLRPGI